MTAFGYTSGNPTNLTSGGSASMADIQGPLTDVAAFLNSRTFNEDNLPVSLLQRLGLNDASGQKGRGKSIIAQSEARTNTAYGLMTTPDRVSGIVLPTDGLICIGYQATWFESVIGAARAAIFIGATQLKIATNGTAPAVQEAGPRTGLATTANALHTFHDGLTHIDSNNSYGGDVTTGQVIGGAIGGGVCYVFAAAGTYDISVQFKASSGSVTALARKLWVWSLGF